jgi:hypothetical protein
MAHWNRRRVLAMMLALGAGVLSGLGAGIHWGLAVFLH